MDATKNPEYLRSVAAALSAFQEALERFLELHVSSTGFGPAGLAPAVLLRDGVDPKVLASTAAEVSRAAGRAALAPSLTEMYVMVEGVGRVDPVAAWHTIAQPRPVLQPADVLGATNQMLGRLEAMELRARAEAPPTAGVESMHPLIWGAARRLWADEHYREAVTTAAEALIGHVKSLTGRRDIPETALWQEVFSDKAPDAGKPRLRWPGNPMDRDVRSMNDGLRQFAPGVQMTIRNSSAHSTEQITPQQGLERLAVLSLLAGWVQSCTVESTAASSSS